MDVFRYKLIFHGEVVEGRDPENVKRGIAARFKIDPAKVEKMFCGRPVVIKKDLTMETAMKYQSALESAGAKSEMAAMKQVGTVGVLVLPERKAGTKAEEGKRTMVCPKCGFEQPASVSCLQCGIVIAKFSGTRKKEEEGPDCGGEALQSSKWKEGPEPSPSLSFMEPEYVGLFPRAGAMLIDTLLFMIVFMIVTIPLNLLFGSGTNGPAGFIDFFLAWVVPPLVTISFWAHKFATPGKMAISAKIVDVRTGGKPSNSQLLGRYLAYTLSSLPLLLGFLWIAFDSRKQGWHDKLAGTAVVRSD